MSFATEDRPGPGATATATDRRVAVATTTTMPAGDHPRSGRETVTADGRREIALRRVKTRAQRLNYRTADQRLDDLQGRASATATVHVK